MTQERIAGDDRTGCRPEQREGPGFAFKKPSAQILQACGLQNDRPGCRPEQREGPGFHCLKTRSFVAMILRMRSPLTEPVLKGIIHFI